jgi:hypothetical protein
VGESKDLSFAKGAAGLPIFTDIPLPMVQLGFSVFTDIPLLKMQPAVAGCLIFTKCKKAGKGNLFFS